MRRSTPLLWSAIYMAFYLAILVTLSIQVLPNEYAVFASAQHYQRNALATRMMGPHIALIAVGLLISWFAWRKHVRGLVLMGLIAYGCSLLFMPNHFLFILLPLLLSFAAFSKMGTESEDDAYLPPEHLTLKQRYDRMWSAAIHAHHTGADEDGHATYDPAPDMLLMITAILAMAALLVVGAVLLLKYLGSDNAKQLIEQVTSTLK